MTPLEYIASNPTLEDMQSKALLFSPELHDSMQSKQANINTNHIISPVLLEDGRYGSSCDLLSECNPGGVYHELFNALDTELLNTAELVDMSDLMELIPEPETLV